jgi:hypothetical protein
MGFGTLQLTVFLNDPQAKNGFYIFKWGNFGRIFQFENYMSFCRVPVAHTCNLATQEAEIRKITV